VLTDTAITAAADMAPAQTPGHAVRAGQAMAVAAESFCLDAEAVQLNPLPGQCLHNRADLLGPLPTANRAHTHQALRGQLDPSCLVYGSALQVVCPERADNASMITVSGTNARPEASGEHPETTCNVTGSRKVAPVSAAYTMNVTALVTLNCRWVNSDSGSIGAVARCFRARKTASPTMPAAIMASTAGDDQRSAGASMNANVRAGQEDHRGRCARVVDPAADGRVTRLGDVPCAKDDYRGRQGDVDVSTGRYRGDRLLQGVGARSGRAHLRWSGVRPQRRGPHR
jgi:hypothetical protein